MAELLPIENIGTAGVITDIPPWQLPPNAWSNANNVRFDDVSVKKMPGYTEVMKDIPEPPLYLETYQLYDSGVYYWLAFCLENIYCYSGNSWSDVTPDPKPKGDPNIQWQTAKLGAVLVATNGVDTPYWWKLDNGIPNVTNKFEPLPGWLEEWDNCQTMAGFKSFMFAGSVDDNVTNIKKNRLVAWSDMASQYEPPKSWDYTDPDGDAGIYELLDSEGPIVHMAQLRESIMIYKTDSIVIGNFIGAPFMFGFQVLSPEVGLMCKNAVAEFPSGHFFIGRTDCYINNGQTITPILTQKVKSQLFENIDADAAYRSFCVTDYANKEIWACYPSANSTYCDMALIWNYVNNTFTIRDMPRVSHVKSGIASYIEGDTWDDQDIAWDDITMKWGSSAFDTVTENLVFASTGDHKIYRHDAGNTEDGVIMNSTIERTGIDLGDPSSVKHVTAVWPKFWSSSHDNVLRVWTGYQMSTDDPITWEGPVLYNPDTMSKISVRTTGKLFGIKIESLGDFDWFLSGLEWEVIPAGRRGSRVYA